MPRRYPWHDFRRPGHYLLTLKAAASCRERFVTVDSEGGVHDNPLGALIRAQWLELMEETEGLLKTHTFQLMPDHLHAEVEVLVRMPKAIGIYLARFKALATGRARRKLGFPQDAPLWESSYDWRIKVGDEEIESAQRYVEKNPEQLSLKRRACASFGAASEISHPKLPLRWPDDPCGQWKLPWKSLGNRKLLGEEIWQCRISRRTSDTDIALRVEQALARAQAGAVCISPSISPGEREVFQSVVRANGKAILLASKPLTMRYHPPSWAMEALSAGRLLVLSPLTEEGLANRITKIMAEHLNACAAYIARRSLAGVAKGEP